MGFVFQITRQYVCHINDCTFGFCHRLLPNWIRLFRPPDPAYRYSDRHRYVIKNKSKKVTESTTLSHFQLPWPPVMLSWRVTLIPCCIVYCDNQKHISCYETISECTGQLWCEHTCWHAFNHLCGVAQWIPSHNSLVMNYSWVNTAPVVIPSCLQTFTVATDQRSAVISAQVVKNVGYVQSSQSLTLLNDVTSCSGLGKCTSQSSQMIQTYNTML